MMKNVISKIIFGLAFVMLVISMSLLISSKVSSKAQSDILFDNSRFVSAEKEYRKEVSNILAAHKCFESGINLTREVSLEGTRTYQLYLHNRMFEKMDDTEFEQIADEIEQISIMISEGMQFKPQISFSR